MTSLYHPRHTVAWWAAQYAVPFPTMNLDPRYFVNRPLRLAPEVPLKADARPKAGRPQTKRHKGWAERAHKMARRGGK